MRPGAHNAITDVPGVRVGHATRDEPGWLTGTTVVVPPVGTTAGVDVRGGGPGTRETDLLDPRNLVDAVDAIVLSGGSAYGLSSADGVVAALADEGRGWPVGPGPGEVVPIVPAAILFDLGRAGAWRHHPGPDEGRAAYLAASNGPVDEGGVGAGTGARAGGLRGGVGSASLVLSSGATVGALVAVNAVGSPLSPDGRLLAERLLVPGEVDLPEPDPVAVQAHWERQAAEAQALRAGTATTLAVVATDARLDKAGCSKLAGVAHDGFARALSPVHTAFDGDTVFALSTPGEVTPTPFDVVELQTAAADCVSRAIARAVLAAASVDHTDAGGAALPGYRETLSRR
ncbi:P1 family peptidase [Janibacter sp. G368]|uniref:P1 family peptidase n=1 Tax=Janibacter sp. G368 TaxID=3420441 RepID=UPI003D06DA2A